MLGTRGELVSGERDMPLPHEEDRPQPGIVEFRDDVLRGNDIRVAYTTVEFPQTPGAQPVLVQVAETLDKRSQLANDIIKGVILPQFVILPLAIVLVILAIRFPAWRSRVTFAILSLLIAWRGTDAWQHFFARPRRLDWVVKHETAFSYPSSHTAIAVAFYLVLAIFVARSALPGRAWIASVIAVLAVAIAWSRLALGAHYLTDIAGGVLWGGTIVGALAACWPTNVFEGRSRSTLE